MKCQCPFCLAEFEVKPRHNMSDEERAKRGARLAALRAAGIGGRPKGSKNRKERSDKGVKRNGGVSWTVQV